MVKCHGCLVVFDSDTDQAPAPAHPYIGAVHNCWRVYSEILAKEFSDPEYFKVHRITVDAYSAQHIGDQSDRRARQSANLHLIVLYLGFEKNLGVEKIRDFLKAATIVKRDWPAITQITNPNWLNVLDVVSAQTALNHHEIVKKWGQSVWDMYKDHHKNIIETYEKFCLIHKS